jgi:polysaccharide chain length determinant protein (PEP-CTERM system associated)
MSAMEEGQGIQLQDYWFILLRRKWFLIIPAVLGLIGGWIALQYFLPKSYQASALIMVEPPAVSSDVVRPIERSTSEGRLKFLEQEFMSRKFLEPVLREFDLYGAAHVKPEGIDGLVRQFRNHIDVDTSSAGWGSDRDVVSFKVSFDGPDPDQVMEVTNKIAELFILYHQNTVSVQVEGTTGFLESELSDLRTTLEKQEAAIAVFRKEHMGALPEQLSSNLQVEERTKMELKAVDEDIDNAIAKKAALTKILQEAKEGDTIASRLADLRRQLNDLLARYKENYPDVLMTKQQIEQLEALQRNGLDSPQDPAALSGRGGEGVRLQIGELNLTIDSLKRKKKNLEDRISEYEQRINDTPRREQQLMILMRDYENLKKNYQSLLDKRLTATLSKNMQAGQPGGTLRILEPAYLPNKPFRPDPLRVMLISLVLGGGCGAGVVLLLEYSDASFRKPEDLEQALGLPVLAAIPPFPAKGNVSLIRKSESVLK